MVQNEHQWMVRVMYHTQEHRSKELSSPIKCLRDDAWLGEGYYFWYSRDDVDMWGAKSKNRTGSYEIYEATINCSNVLDTVFNEEHYLFWLRQIENVAKKIVKTTGEKPTIKEINDYFREKATWDEIDGILFQDLSSNPNLLLVKPIQYTHRQRPFVYKKRIQLAVYTLDIVKKFVLLTVEKIENQ